MSLAYLMPNAPRDHDEEAAVVAALRNPSFIIETEKPDIARLVTHLMEQSTSIKIRNAAALLLTDLVGKGATESIAGVLRRPEMAISAGSLLFALNDIGASLPLDLVTDMIERGSFEAQGEALAFLDESRIEPFTALQFDAAKNRLTSLKESSLPNAIHAAEIALDYLDRLNPIADHNCHSSERPS